MAKLYELLKDKINWKTVNLILDRMVYFNDNGMCCVINILLPTADIKNLKTKSNLLDNTELITVYTISVNGFNDNGDWRKIIDGINYMRYYNDYSLYYSFMVYKRDDRSFEMNADIRKTIDSLNNKLTYLGMSYINGYNTIPAYVFKEK